MLQLNKELDVATLPDRREQIKARIGHTDEKIDQMVYQLYRLTAEEIAIQCRLVKYLNADNADANNADFR